MEGHHHPHHLLHHQQQPQQVSSINVDAAGDRFPQWSIQETREFLMIRAELDPTFMETKRNKLLWGVISTKMRDKGFNRSAEQCKCKWKNLVTRYKGCETMELEAVRQQFPFYHEIHAIFTARMERMLWAEEGEEGAGTKKRAGQLSSDEEEENEESEEGRKGVVRKKMKKGKSGGASSGNDLSKILEGFMREQVKMEIQWREAYEARENERRVKEMEWRQMMEAIENERVMMDRRWREREEQRRIREEVRAEKRDALIVALLNKLRREEQNPRM